MVNKINNIIAQAAQAKDQNWLKALTILQTGLDEFAHSAKLLEAIGDLYLSKNKNKRAIEYYRRADKVLPGNENTLHKLANLHMLSFNFTAAKNYLDQVANPSNASIFKKAVCCMHLQLPEQATDLLESIMDDPGNPEAVLFLLSEQYLALKDFDKAKSLIQLLKAKFPHSEKVTFLWGYYFYCRGKWLAAYDYLLQAEKQGFTFLGNIKILARVAQRVGLFAQAIDYYRKALRYSPFDSAIFENLINIYLGLGQEEKAKIIAKKIPVFVPKSKRLIDLIRTLNQKP